MNGGIKRALSFEAGVHAFRVLASQQINDQKNLLSVTMRLFHDFAHQLCIFFAGGHRDFSFALHKHSRTLFGGIRELRTWLRDWFLRTLSHMTVECLAWEGVIKSISIKEKDFGSELSAFYQTCLKFNRIQKPDL
jgi:hypothetical protein